MKSHDRPGETSQPQDVSLGEPAKLEALARHFRCAAWCPDGVAARDGGPMLARLLLKRAHFADVDVHN